MVTIVMISHLIVFTYNNRLTCKVYYKTLMLMYYNVSCFFLYFSFSSHTVDDPSINIAACHKPTGSEVVWLHGGLHGPVVSLRILKIFQTESSVEYRSKSCYIDYSHNFEYKRRTNSPSIRCTCKYCLYC